MATFEDCWEPEPKTRSSVLEVATESPIPFKAAHTLSKALCNPCK